MKNLLDYVLLPELELVLGILILWVTVSVAIN